MERKDAAGQPIAQAVALAFGGVWWFCTRQALNAFLTPFLAMLAAMLVFLSHSLLGVAV